MKICKKCKEEFEKLLNEFITTTRCNIYQAILNDHQLSRVAFEREGKLLEELKQKLNLKSEDE